ncbi:restriction endonuclease [Streptomyces sp. NPDC002537]
MDELHEKIDEVIEFADSVDFEHPTASLGLLFDSPLTAPEMKDAARSALEFTHQATEVVDQLLKCEEIARSCIRSARGVDKSHRRRKTADWMLHDVNKAVEGFRSLSSIPIMLGAWEKTFCYASSPVLDMHGMFEPSRKLLDRFASHVREAGVLIEAINRSAAELTEALEHLTPELARPVAAMHMEDIDSLHYSEFEYFVADLMDRDGYRVIRSGGGAGDQGGDVIAMDEFGRHLLVQCKHGTGKSVGQDVAQHLYGGAMAIHTGTLPIIVTTQQITGGAREWGREGDRVRFVDRVGLKRWAEDGERLNAVIAPSARP